MRKFYISMIVVLLVLWGQGLALLWCAGEEVTPRQVIRLSEGLTPAQLTQERKLARWYNFSLRMEPGAQSLTNAYDQLLNFGSGRMGYLEIQEQDVLPIYHAGGRKDGAVHRQETSLPVGGRGNCTVLECEGVSLSQNQVFRIHILDSVLTYQVTQIGDGLPTDIQGDLCVLAVLSGQGTVYVTGERIEVQE